MTGRDYYTTEECLTAVSLTLSLSLSLSHSLSLSLSLFFSFSTGNYVDRRQPTYCLSRC